MLYFSLQWLQVFKFPNLQGQNCWAQDIFDEKGEEQGGGLSLVPIHPFFVRENQAAPRAHNLFPQALVLPGCPDRIFSLMWPGWPLDIGHAIPSNSYQSE